MTVNKYKVEFNENDLIVIATSARNARQVLKQEGIAGGAITLFEKNVTELDSYGGYPGYIL